MLDGELWLAMLWQSRTASDLFRNPRVLVHSIVSSRDCGDGAFKLRVSARSVDAESTERRYADAVGRLVGCGFVLAGFGGLGSRDLRSHPVPGRFHLFAVYMELVTCIRYTDATGDQFTAIWPPAQEFVRRHDSYQRRGRRRSSTNLALIHVRREALTIRVEVRDLHRCSCRSRMA